MEIKKCLIDDADNILTLYKEARSLQKKRKMVSWPSPMDLDFSMLLAFPDAYNVEKVDSDDSTIKAVLGKSHHDTTQYSEDELKLFSTYHKRFKLGSKPAAHIDALAQLNDADLVANMPESFRRLADSVIAKLVEQPE